MTHKRRSEGRIMGGTYITSARVPDIIRNISCIITIEMFISFIVKWNRLDAWGNVSTNGKKLKVFQSCGG